jgi:hypothetical protein
VPPLTQRKRFGEYVARRLRWCSRGPSGCRSYTERPDLLERVHTGHSVGVST